MKKLGIIMICLFFAFTFQACKQQLDGCTDENSLSYNPDATDDNGGCVYPDKVQRALVLKYTAMW